MQQALPQLIVFLEISSHPIISLIEGVEPFCNMNYPYEYHLTVGWFTDEDPETLRKWGNQSLNYVKELICQSDENYRSVKESLCKILITGAARQPMSRGGGFYLQPAEQDTKHLLKIHKELSSFMHQNQVHSSELISNYHPHVSLTTPITLETINADQEIKILKTINDKISNLQGSMPEKLILQPIAIHTILKYTDCYGNEQKEIWATKTSAIKTAINSERSSVASSSLLQSN